jgi:hypothetical protein
MIFLKSSCSAAKRAYWASPPWIATAKAPM